MTFKEPIERVLTMPEKLSKKLRHPGIETSGPRMNAPAEVRKDNTS
jgi:hypothetical protein